MNPNERILGYCSLCGGEVVEFIGAWSAIVPAPTAHCTQCKATKLPGPVIDMNPGSAPKPFTPFFKTDP